MASDEEEILDLVDENDKVVGTITHAEIYDQTNLRGRYIRASNAFVINGKSQLWIPRRPGHKKIAPNGLDFSMGEHVQAGESYMQGALRGFREELNLGLQAEDLVFFGMINPLPDLPPYFTANYFYLSDKAPDYNKDDFVSAEWLDPQEVIRRVKGGDKAKTSLVPTIELLLRQKLQSTGH